MMVVLEIVGFWTVLMTKQGVSSYAISYFNIISQ